MQRDSRWKRGKRKSCNNLEQVHAAAGLLCTAKGGSPGQCSMEHTAAAAAEIPKYKNSQIQEYTVKEGESDPGQCSMEHTSASRAAAQEKYKKEIQSWSHYRTDSVFCCRKDPKKEKHKYNFWWSTQPLVRRRRCCCNLQFSCLISHSSWSPGYIWEEEKRSPEYMDGDQLLWLSQHSLSRGCFLGPSHMSGLPYVGPSHNLKY